MEKIPWQDNEYSDACHNAKAIMVALLPLISFAQYGSFWSMRVNAYIKLVTWLRSVQEALLKRHSTSWAMSSSHWRMSPYQIDYLVACTSSNYPLPAYTFNNGMPHIVDIVLPIIPS